MDHQDWNPVTFKGATRGNRTKAEQVAQAKREGNVTIERKFAAGENKSAQSSTGANIRKVEEETEQFHVTRVDRSFGVALQQARTGKGWSQKDLANRISEKPNVVGEYESGRAVPNPAIVTKMERALGVHLPRTYKKK